MRRFAFLIAVAGISVVGCTAADPTSPAAAPDVSTQVRNDSTPPEPATTAEGGIMMGSGT